MNSITRPRRRCRVKSVNFKVFAWLLVREAALAIDGPTYWRETERATRRFLAAAPTYEILRLHRGASTWPHRNR